MFGGITEGVVATRREEKGEKVWNRDRAPMLMNNDNGTTTSCLRVKEQCSCALELHRLRCPVETAATNNIIVNGRTLIWPFRFRGAAVATGALLQTGRNRLATTRTQMSSISNEQTTTLMASVVNPRLQGNKTRSKHL